MWIAVAAVAAIVVGVVAWRLRREPAGGDTPGTFDVERTWDWAPRPAGDAEAAFVEGLRACHGAGTRLRVAADRGVVTTYDPPALVSLPLLADAFAALGDAALHDPHGTVAALIARYAAAEEPGVLHLRTDRPSGADRAAFAAAVREVVCPPEAEGLSALPDDDGGGGGGAWGVGALQVRVLAGGAEEGWHANTLLLDLGRAYELCAEAREKDPEAAEDTLLRQVVSGLVAAGGPGLTWVRPPTPEERRAVLSATGSSELL
ncbi:MAG TPA: hypothetical protein VFV66_01690 [Nonomuraea sp.]|nr:hypothetical protein [Nonomuraea sp.]